MFHHIQRQAEHHLNTSSSISSCRGNWPTSPQKFLVLSKTGCDLTAITNKSYRNACIPTVAQLYVRPNTTDEVMICC